MDAISASKSFCIGLTGGIGSGKTTVANFFAKLGVPIVDADDIAHRITLPNGVAYPKIIDHFGKKILNDDKTLNRKKLRDIIFENETEKEWLENYLHPLIRDAMLFKIQKIKSPYCICVIPLLAESTDIHFIDRVLVIDAPIKLQLERARKRDTATKESIQKIMDSQATQASRLAIADDVLTNDGDLKSLENKVEKLHQQYAKLVNVKK